MASPVPPRDPRNGPRPPLSEGGQRGMMLQGGQRGCKGGAHGGHPQPWHPSRPFPWQRSIPQARQPGPAPVAHVAGTARCRGAGAGGLPGSHPGPGSGDHGGIGAGPARLQTSAARRDSRHVYLQQQNKEPIIYTKHTTMSVNKEAAGEGKAIYSNSANFSSSTIKKALIIFRNNRQLTNRFSRCK